MKQPHLLIMILLMLVVGFGAYHFGKQVGAQEALGPSGSLLLPGGMSLEADEMRSQESTMPPVVMEGAVEEDAALIREERGETPLLEIPEITEPAE